MKQAQNTSTPAVYMAISAVQSAMAKLGVGKTQKNTQQNFNYRGIDQLLVAIAPVMAENQLLMLPSVLSRETTERPREGGKVTIHTWVEVKYALISAVDGSSVDIIVQGEAMDFGDKSFGKAMAYAHKVAIGQAFVVPITGKDDPDADSPEADPKKDPKTPPPSPKTLSALVEEATAAGHHLDNVMLFVCGYNQAESKENLPDHKINPDSRRIPLTALAKINPKAVKDYRDAGEQLRAGMAA